MKDIRIGDVIKSVSKDGDVVYDEVYMMAHADPDAEGQFIKIKHVGPSLLASSRTLFTGLGLVF
jgi:hypothetical protein